jgi:hypothetical protein
MACFLKHVFCIFRSVDLMLMRLVAGLNLAFCKDPEGEVQMRARVFGSVFAGFCILFCAGNADATLVTDMINFSVTGFIANPGTDTPPQDTVTGSVTITFDPSATMSTPITPVDAVNLTIGGHTYSASEVNFQFSPSQGDALVIGAGNPNNITEATDDFQLAFKPIFTFFGFEYTTPGFEDVFVNTDGATISVPEPGSFALLGTALAGMFAIRWRYRRSGRRASFT